MEKKGILRKYELVVIVDANLTPDGKDVIVKQAADLVTKHGGKVINTQVWFEKQRFTFRIKKCSEGSYYLINFESNGEGLVALDQDLRVHEQVLRYILSKVEKPAAVAALK